MPYDLDEFIYALFQAVWGWEGRSTAAILLTAIAFVMDGCGVDSSSLAPLLWTHSVAYGLQPISP